MSLTPIIPIIVRLLVCLLVTAAWGFSIAWLGTAFALLRHMFAIMFRDSQGQHSMLDKSGMQSTVERLREVLRFFWLVLLFSMVALALIAAARELMSTSDSQGASLSPKP